MQSNKIAIEKQEILKSYASPNLSKDFGYLHEQFTIHTQSLCSSDFMVTKIPM